MMLVAVLAAVLAWMLWEDGGSGVGGEVVDAGSVRVPVGGPRGTEGDGGELRGLGFASISGKVSDPGGRAIAGARVCAFASSRLLDAADTWQPSCALAGRDGVYVIARLWAVRQRVSASAPGHVPAFYMRGEGAGRRDTIDLRAGVDVKGVDIVLPGGGVELRGVVKDLSGGAIEGAIVTSGGLFYGTGMAVTTSGPEGEFSLWVRPGRPQVWARAEGYAGGSDMGAAPGHFFELFMTPEAVLVGRVVRASDGSPVAGAAVTADRGDAWGGSGTTHTDADGRFRLDRLSPGAYKPKAESDDAYGVAAEQVVLGLGQTSQPIEIRAHPAFVVEGRVFVAGGGSCERGMVRLADAGSGRERSADLEGDGVAHLAGMLEGTYEVTVSCPGLVAAERYEPVVIAGASATGLTWEVTRGQAIRGVVVSAKGEPIAGVSVSARGKADAGRPRTRTTDAYGVESDAQGRFELAGLLPGAYDVRAYTTGQQRALPSRPVEVTLPEGQDAEGVRIEAPAVGEVRGEVRDAQGTGLARVEVRLRGSGRGTQAMTADDGTFTVPEVEAGEYRAVASRDRVTLRAPGTGDDDVQGVKVVVRAGEVETVKLVVETGAGKIGGTVRDADGAAVSDAFVEAARESESAAGPGGPALGWWFRGDDRPHLTDADGRFAIEALFPGKYTVRAFRRGGGEAVAEHVALGSEVALTIAATGRLAGSVALAGGGAPQEFSVTVEEKTTGYRRTDAFFRTQGAWSFAELPQGNFKVQVSAAEGTQALDVSLGAGEERAGVRVELAGKVTVRGTVVDLEGAPVPGVEVRVSESGSFRFGADGGDKKFVSDAAGRFEVERAPTGTVTVMASPPRGEDHASARFTTTIAGGPVVELPPIRLAKQGVGPGETPGDLGITYRLPETGADPLQRRLIVAFVRPGGPAASAGVQVGDEVIAVGGQDVTGANSHLYGTLSRVPAGTAVRLGLARGVTVEVVAGALP